MITTIRSQFKQATYRYFVLFMVFVFIMSLVSSLFVKTERAYGGGASWAIRVNGAEISYQQYAKEVAKQSEYLAQIKAQYGQYADLLFQSMGWTFDPKSRAIDILIKEELVKQYGEQLGIKLHPDYISKVLNDSYFVKQNLGHIIPPFVYDSAGVLDMNILNEFLRQRGISAQQFEGEIEKALAQVQVLEYIATSCYVPKCDIKQQFIAKYLNKQFSYLTFSFDHYLAEEKKNNITNEDLQAFYDTQNTLFRRYWVPEQRAAMIWKFEPKNYNISISDEEIQEYYEDNKVKQYVLDPLKVEVQQILLDKVAKDTNKTIDEVEKDLQEKSTSLEKHWKTLKPFARGEHKGELDKNAFVLQHEGEVSPVFETKDGKTAVRLVKRIPRTYKPLISVKKDIETILVDKAFKKNFVKDIKNVLSNDDIKSMEAFILEKGGNKETVSPLAKDESQLSLQLFSLKKNSYGFFVEKGKGVAVLLTDIIERHLPDLTSIKDVVKNDLHEERAQKSLQDKLAQAKKEVEIKSFEALKGEFNASLASTEMFNAHDYKKVQEISKRGLPVHEMLALEKEGSVIVYNGDRNSLLIKLDTVEDFDQDRLAALSSEIKDHLGPIRTRLQLDGVVASLHRNATIETNDTVLITSEDYSE